MEAVFFCVIIGLQAWNIWQTHCLAKIPKSSSFRSFAPDVEQIAVTDDEAFSVYTADGTWLFDRYPGHPDLAVLENNPGFKVVRN